MKANWTFVLAWLLAVAAVAEANAQTGQYPTKPVQIITDSSAIGAPILASSWGQPHDAHRRHRSLPPDVYARLVASVLSDILGQHTSGGRTCG